VLLIMRALSWIVLVALSIQADLVAAANTCSFKIEQDRVGAVELGHRIKTSGRISGSKEIELPGESPQFAQEIEFACGVKVFAILGSRSQVTTVIVRDSSISDARGIRVGMSFQEVMKKLPGAKLYAGEEEGGYLTLGSGRIRYIFTTAGVPRAALGNQADLILLAKSQMLEEIRLILPTK
jgi:hypothetical protein